MFNLFKNLFKLSNKQELEQQLNEAIAVAQKLNEEIKTLKTANIELAAENATLKNDFISAIDRVRYLDGQVRMLELQKQSKNQYSDNDRNY